MARQRQPIQPPVRVRNKRLGLKIRRYCPEDFQKAVEAVRRGEMSFREAAKAFSVPRTTLQDRVNETHVGISGRPTELTAEEEKMIVDRLLVMASWGFPFSQKDLREFVKEYLNKKGVVNKTFINNRPTHRWVASFLGRHRCLTMRMANPLKRARAKVSKEDISTFLTNWEETVEGVPRCNIFNYDETNMRDDPGSSKCIFREVFEIIKKIFNCLTDLHRLKTQKIKYR